MILQGTLGVNFVIFAASGESTAWVLLWKTRSIPIGVKLCFVSQFDFFGTAFDSRKWTMVVFWKEDSGRQLRLITTEDEGGDETRSPSQPKFNLLMNLMFLFVQGLEGLVINLVDLHFQCSALLQTTKNR